MENAWCIPSIDVQYHLTLKPGSSYFFLDEKVRKNQG